MRKILFALIVFSASIAWAQNGTVIYVPPQGGVIPPPDIVGASRAIAEAPARAEAQAAQTALIRQQTTLLRQQAEQLKQQNEALRKQQESAAHLAAPNSGHYTTGNDLHDDCVSAIAGQSGAMAGLCVGIVDGYRQLAVMLPPSANLQILCLPDGVSNGELVKVVVKFLDEHPEKLHLPAAEVIYEATSVAFPCPAAAQVAPTKR